MINVLFWRFAGLSLIGSAVLLPLLLASRFIRQRYAARTCYVLWLLLALRLILPLPVIQIQQAMTVEVPQYEVVLGSSARVDAETASAKPQIPVQAGNAASTPAASSPSRTVSLTALLPGLWLMGMAGCGLWLAVSYALVRWTLLRNVKPGGPEDETMLNALSQELGCRRCPKLYRSNRVSTPMLLGLIRPVVLLPAEELPEEELPLMLRHELTHLRRHDVAYKLFLQMVCVVHWFNPLVWWMSREAGRNLELCCDEDVVRGRDKAFCRTYGDMLLKTAAGTGRTPALSARMGGGKSYLKVRLNNLFFQKKNSAALVCAVLAAAILGGSLVSCTGEAPEETPEDDMNAVTTSFRDPAEVQEELDKWALFLESSNDFPVESFVDLSANQTDQQQLEAAMKQIQQKHEKLKAEMMNLLAILELEESVVMSRLGVVSFTIPADYQGNDEWQIEIKGRVKYDDISGMSLHHGFDRVELQPGMQCSYAFAGEWSGITDLYLSVTLGGQSKDINLLTIMPSDMVKNTLEEWMDGLSERWYVRDKGGFGGDFSIRLEEDGTFQYYAGFLSSYIGMGTWTCDGKTVCLADEGLKDSAGIQYYYFTVDEEGNLLFQAENSAAFLHVDVADGDRFSQKPIKPAYFGPSTE